MHKIVVLPIVALVMLVLSGCLSMEFESKGTKVNEPLYDEYCWACLWFDFWWGDNPSDVCKISDKDSVKVGDVCTYRPGYRELKISSGGWTVFPAFATFGAFTPMKVTCYKSKDERLKEETPKALK